MFQPSVQEIKTIARCLDRGDVCIQSELIELLDGVLPGKSFNSKPLHAFQSTHCIFSLHEKLIL